MFPQENIKIKTIIVVEEVIDQLIPWGYLDGGTFGDLISFGVG